MLPLSEIKNRHNSCLPVLGRVALEDLIDELQVLLVELERDTRVIFRRVAVLHHPREGLGQPIELSP